MNRKVFVFSVLLAVLAAVAVFAVPAFAQGPQNVDKPADGNACQTGDMHSMMGAATDAQGTGQASCGGGNSADMMGGSAEGTGHMSGNDMMGGKSRMM